MIIRSEDVWFAIITQFSFYVNGHAEELRSFFVSFGGKRKLTIRQELPMDLEQFAKDMTTLVAQNIKDPALREWILPAFTTTTNTDRVVASILMIGTMKKYFVYDLSEVCGIPSVMLLGERSDWLDILQRLSFLTTVNGHKELLLWYSFLKPIVSSFVRTFDAPSSTDIVDFWRNIVREDGLCGLERGVTGWINAFCFWDAEGKLTRVGMIMQNSGNSVVRTESKAKLDYLCKSGCIDWPDLPAGFVHVPVHIKFPSIDVKYVATMVAGSVGWRALDSKVVISNIHRKAAEGSETSSGSMSEFKPSDKERGDSTSPSEAPSATAAELKSNGQTHGEKRISTSRLQSVLSRLVCLSPTNNVTEIHEKQEKEQTEREKETNSSAFIQESTGSGRGTMDTLQPVSGWWAFKTKTGQYGKDEDCPDVQYDSDAEDYDRELAEIGRPI